MPHYCPCESAKRYFLYNIEHLAPYSSSSTLYFCLCFQPQRLSARGHSCPSFEVGGGSLWANVAMTPTYDALFDSLIVFRRTLSCGFLFLIIEIAHGFASIWFFSYKQHTVEEGEVNFLPNTWFLSRARNFLMEKLSNACFMHAQSSFILDRVYFVTRQFCASI